jgi:hypothetical protein
MGAIMTGKRHFSSICLALTLITQLAPARAAQSAWYRLTGSGGDFTVEFPSRPTYEVVPVPSTGERLQTYNIAYGNNYLYFNYIDLRLKSAAAQAPIATRLEVYARGYTKTIIDAGGQVLMRTLLPDGGTEFVSKYPAGKAQEMSYEQSRVYFQGARRYVLSCTSLSTSGIDQSLAKRFFSSFQLYGMRKPGGVDKDVSKIDSNSSAGNPADTAWYRFTNLDGDFEAEFPDKPDFDTKAHPVTGAQMQVVSFTYGEYDFGVQSVELVPSLNTPAEREQWLVSATEKFLRGSESRLIRQTRRIDGALQIEAQRQLDGRTMFIKARVYARGSRGYVVHCSVFSQRLAALDEPLPARFFASFRFKWPK